MGVEGVEGVEEGEGEGVGEGEGGGGEGVGVLVRMRTILSDAELRYSM